MIAADLGIPREGKYLCPECHKHYSLRWIRRHLVTVHGYVYWKGRIVYDPTLPENKVGATLPPKRPFKPDIVKLKKLAHKIREQTK